MAMTLKDWTFWTEGDDGADYSQSLYELARHFKCVSGLEIGVRFGKSALPFLLAHDQATLVGFDPNPEFDILGFMKERGVLDRFMFINDFSPQAIIECAFEPETFDWIYIDGEHTKDAIIKDYKATWDLLAPGGIMVFDDVDKSLGYNTETLEALKELGITEWKTSADFGLTPNPHKCAVIVKA